MITSELEAAIANAHRAADVSARELVVSVHELRKELRRMRAVIDLLRDVIPRAVRRSVRDSIRTIRRGLADARDRDVAPRVLEQLALDDADRSAAQLVTATAAATRPSSEQVRRLVADSADATAAYIVAVIRELPDIIDTASIRDGIEESYRAARRARKAAHHDVRAFHRWRRRCKELAYQLAVIGSHPECELGELYSALSATCEAQGPVADLVMVSRFIHRHGDGTCDTLRDTVASQLGSPIKRIRRNSRELFRLKPREFSRRCTRRVHR